MPELRSSYIEDIDTPAAVIVYINSTERVLHPLWIRQQEPPVVLPWNFCGLMQYVVHLRNRILARVLRGISSRVYMIEVNGRHINVSTERLNLALIEAVRYNVKKINEKESNKSFAEGELQKKLLFS